MDGTPRAMAAAARFARFHASRDTGACLPSSFLKMSGQTVRRREQGNGIIGSGSLSRPLMAA